MVDFAVNVKIDPSGAAAGSAAVKAELNSIQAAATQVGNVIKNVFVFAGIGFGVKALADLVDAYTNVQNRVRLVTEGHAQLEVVMGHVFNIASDTGVKVELVANVYQRLASATKNLGLSQNDILDVTRGLSEAAVLSGTSFQKMQFGLQEVAQGMGQASLKGREIRAIINDIPAAAQAIVDQLNRTNPSLHATTATLKELGTQGKITPQLIVDAFRGAGLDKINEQFDKITPTIARAFQSLRTNVIQWVGDFNQASGASGIFSNAILAVAHNVDTFARSILALATFLGVNYAYDAIKKAIQGTIAFTAALVTNPVVAMIEALILLTTFVVAFGDKLQIGGGHIANFQDLAITAWQDIVSGAQKMYDWFASYFPGITKLISDTFGGASFAGVVEALAKGLDTIVTLFLATGAAIVAAFANIPNSFKLVFGEAFNAIFSVMQTSINYIVDSINTVTEKLANVAKLTHVTIQPFDLSDARKGLSSGPGDAFGNALANPSTVAQDATKSFFSQADQLHQQRADAQAKAAAARKAAEDALNDHGDAIPGSPAKLETFENIINKIKGETEAYKELDPVLRQVGLEEAKVAAQLKEKQLTPDQKAQLDQAYAQLTLQKQEAQIYDNLTKATRNQTEGQAALNDLLSQGKISLAQYNQEMNKLDQAVLSTGRDMESGFKKGLLEVQDKMGNVADLASKTVVDSFGKAEDALVQFAETGKLSFTDLINSILDDLTRLAVRAAIIAPLANALGIGGPGGTGASFTSSGGTGGGIGGGLLSLGGSLFNGGGIGNLFGSQGSLARLTETGSSNFIGPLPVGGGGGGGILDSIGSFFGSLGFATGGSFQVGGYGGIDSQLVGFHATPGEMVNITKPGSGPSNDNSNSSTGKNITLVQNIQTQDSNSFKNSQGQIAARTQALLTRAGNRNN